MASTARSRMRAVRSPKATAKTSPATAPQSGNTYKKPVDPAKAKRELLDDLMGDVRKCFANKSTTEQRSVAFAIGKIARS